MQCYFYFVFVNHLNGNWKLKRKVSVIKGDIIAAENVSEECTRLLVEDEVTSKMLEQWGQVVWGDLDRGADIGLASVVKKLEDFDAPGLCFCSFARSVYGYRHGHHGGQMTMTKPLIMPRSAARKEFGDGSKPLEQPVHGFGLWGERSTNEFDFAGAHTSGKLVSWRWLMKSAIDDTPPVNVRSKKLEEHVRSILIGYGFHQWTCRITFLLKYHLYSRCFIFVALVDVFSQYGMRHTGSSGVEYQYLSSSPAFLNGSQAHGEDRAGASRLGLAPLP